MDSGFIASREDLLVSPRRTGVDGAALCEEEGVDGVGMADRDDCEE